MAASRAHERNGLKRNPWTPEEDQKLITYVKYHGEPRQWTKVPELAGLNRCGRSCRLRWLKYLRSDIKRGNFSQDEEDTIIKLQSVLGNKWSLIAAQLPGRTDTEIKNYWNTRLKKLAKKDIPPATQTPLLQSLRIAAVFLGSCANYLRGYALKLHSDARLPNGVGFISTYPAGALPSQGSGFNYQAMKDPTVNNPPDQFGPLISSILNTGGLIPSPQVNQNYAAHVGSLFGNIPPATQTPIQPLLAVAGWLASTAAYLRGYPLGLHSDAQLPNLHSLQNPVVQPGFGDVTPDPQAQLAGLSFISTDPAQTLSSIPSQAPGFNYDGFDFNSTHPAHTLPRCHNYPDEHVSLIADISTERAVPAVLVSDSTERSRANQVVENEVKPAEESTTAWLKLARRELLMDDETGESFGGGFSPYAVDSKIAEFLSVIADNPNASSIPAPVSASPEPSMANQVVEKITPAGQEIPNSF